jgi:glycosyltransferase involved in cell wall biosynthesis
MILFSYDIFVAQTTGGISRCMIELMRALLATPTEWRLWAGQHGNSLLADEKPGTGVMRHVTSAPGYAKTGRLAGALRNEPGFAKHIRSVSPRIVHRSFYPVFDLVRDRSVRRVETLHDMWDEQASTQRDRFTGVKSLLKRRALHAADAIVCVSESSRREMVEIWPTLADRAVVIHHGVRRLSEQPIAPMRERPFFLFVGRREAYKNFSVALVALHLAALPDFDLICFGGGQFSAGEIAEIAAAGLVGRVVQMAGNDDRLAGLYEAAAALLYPSAYEGFGLPLLEAMIHSCPVISAPWTSLPEVGGDAALYARPDKPDDWALLMAKISQDVSFCTKIREMGRARAAKFSWSHTAEQHAQLYVDVGG